MYQKLLFEIDLQVVLRDWLRADLEQGLAHSGFPCFTLPLMLGLLGVLKFCFLKHSCVATVTAS
jgi:hypothetical protein